ERPVERRILRRYAGLIALIADLDLDRRIAKPSPDLRQPLFFGRTWKHAAVARRFGNRWDDVDFRRIADAGAEGRQRDRRMLDRVVEFVDGKRADSRFHGLEYGDRRAGCRLAQQPRKRADKPVVRILIVRLRGVAGDAFGAQLEPEDLLFRDGDPEDQFSRSEQVAAPETSLVEDVLRID